MEYHDAVRYARALSAYNHLFNMQHETIEIVERAPEEKPERSGKIAFK